MLWSKLESNSNGFFYFSKHGEVRFFTTELLSVFIIFLQCLVFFTRSRKLIHANIFEATVRENLSQKVYFA